LKNTSEAKAPPISQSHETLDKIDTRDIPTIRGVCLATMYMYP